MHVYLKDNTRCHGSLMPRHPCLLVEHVDRAGHETSAMEELHTTCDYFLSLCRSKDQLGNVILHYC